MATRDGYYFIDITWKSGFKHTVPCRGYNLKSEIAFNQSIFWIESFNYYEVTQEQYKAKSWESLDPVDTESKTTKKKSTGAKDNNERLVPITKRSTKARPIAEESKERSTKITRAKRSTTQDGKQDGKRSPAPNKRKPKPAT